MRAPEEFTEAILRRLDVWMNLERHRPALHVDSHPTYRQLYETFNSSLAARNWVEAERALDDIRRNNLSTGDNLGCLEIQSLSQQDRWMDIWRRDDFGDLARLRMPVAVRGALLTAFHFNALLPLEVDLQWTAALDVFREAQARLGLLLTGRFGLTQSPVLHVFAYQAICDGGRLALDKLREVDVNGQDVEFFDALESLLPTVEARESMRAGGAVSLAPLQRARLALADANYDAALLAAEVEGNPLDRSLLLLQIAYVSGDPSIAENALRAFRELPPHTQEEQRSTSHQVSSYLLYAEDLTGVAVAKEQEMEEVEPKAENWMEWLTLAIQRPGEPTLADEIEHVISVDDGRSWTSQIVSQLTDLLLQILETPELYAASLIKMTLRRLADIVLQDAGFPRDDEGYADLYDVLYMAIVQLRQVKQTTSMQFLRFAEARLRHAPARRESVNMDVHEWFAMPMPAIENSLFDAFDLLGEYGLPSGLLADLYREWATYILELPTSRDRASLQAWIDFGEWIRPGDDLLDRFRRMLQHVVEESPADAIAELPASYRIGIFTLRPMSGERARMQLLQRNAQLDVRICMDNVLTEQAKALAQNSELVVVVTTCISHALTYGIGPYVHSEPVYPASSGSTSIVRAVEGRLSSTSR